MSPTQENAAFVDCSTGTSKPWILTVRAVIRDDAGRWLLIRRSGQCEHFVGTWELPGGKADAGETVDVSLLQYT
jgi:8-oxo-dGTP diphosphatase